MNTGKYCRVGNIAQQCRLGLFQDSDFAGDLEDAGLRMDGIPALDLWDFLIVIPHQTKPTKPKKKESHGETCRPTLNQTCENRFQPPTPILI